jgi:hypothetical protein
LLIGKSIEWSSKVPETKIFPLPKLDGSFEIIVKLERLKLVE